MEYMCFNREGAIFPLKFVDSFTYLGSSVSSTESDVNIRLVKRWTDIDWLLITGKSDLSDKTKSNFFQAVVVSVLLYGCTTSTLTKSVKKKLDENCPRMLRVILSKSWKQYLTKQQWYGHLPPISTNIQMRRTRHAGHCKRSGPGSNNHEVMTPDSESFEEEFCCVVANVQDCVHFRTNIPISNPSYGFNCLTTVFLEGWLWH